MALGIGPLKAEAQQKTGTLGVPGTTGAFAVPKIGDDHGPSRANRECRLFERRVLQVHVHHLLDFRRRFGLLFDVHMHR